eukprot:233646_1
MPTQSPLMVCEISIVKRIEYDINKIVNELDDISQQLSRIGDPQIYFQVLQSMNNRLNYYIDNYGHCLSNDIKRIVSNTKFRIIELTNIIFNNNSTTKTYDNLQNQLNIISSILDVFCSGSDAYIDNNNCNSSMDNGVIDSEDSILTINN